MNQYFDIGKIVNVHGIKGEVKIYPYTDHVENLSKLSYLIIDNQECPLLSARIHKKMLIAKFKDITNRSQAETLVNKIVYIHRKDGHQLQKDEHYIIDLLDCLVYENLEYLGKITDIIQTGSNDVYVVSHNQKELLIPAIQSVVTSIDIEQKKITVILPDGLVDDD